MLQLFHPVLNQMFTSSKNCCVFCSMCRSSVNSKYVFFNASAFVFTSFSSFSSFSYVASKSIISRGCGASGLSPTSSIGMPSFFISFSKYPAP